MGNRRNILFIILFVVSTGLVGCATNNCLHAGNYISLEERIKLLLDYSNRAKEAKVKMEACKTCGGEGTHYKKQMRLRKKYLNCYFKVLPNDFETFFEIYGDYDKDFVYSKNPWGTFWPYGKSKPHTEKVPLYLLSLQEAVPIEVLYEKLMSLGVGGCWGGGSETLQTILYRSIFQRMVLAASILEKRTDDEIASLFYFLHDGPHPDHPLIKRDYEVLHEQLELINPRLSTLLKKAYKHLLSEKHCEGH